MKIVKAIIRPDFLEALKDEILENGIGGMTVSSVHGCGRQNGWKEYYRGNEIIMNIVPKIQCEFAVCDDEVDKLIDVITSVCRTGDVGDGKILHYEVIKTLPSEEQKEILKSLSERADDVRNRVVEPDEDNMLKITNDGKKLALDQRLINPLLPDNPDSKVNVCVKNVFAIWDKTRKDRSTQLLFSDMSTPKGDGEFNIYDDIREKLVVMGIPKQEIAFIHEANSDKQKDELFAKVRKGDVRILLGSTQKMGAGTNVQNKLIALHDLDVPWRPADLEQRAGRIVRQGNENKEVNIYRYVTENTFDAYLWQTIENKQKFISQIMTSKTPVRVAEDVDESSLNYIYVICCILQNID